MPRPKFKQKCKMCNNEWVTMTYGQYPICINCHMKQISEEVKDKDYLFLNLPEEIYRKSRFLRSIKENFLRFGSLSDKQIEAFKKAVKELKAQDL